MGLDGEVGSRGLRVVKLVIAKSVGEWGEGGVCGSGVSGMGKIGFGLLDGGWVCGMGRASIGLSNGVGWAV